MYRLKDTSVIVAVDDMPEEGLDQPLRMEKLANEVRSGSVKAVFAVVYCCLHLGAVEDETLMVNAVVYQWWGMELGEEVEGLFFLRQPAGSE